MERGWRSEAGKQKRRGRGNRNRLFQVSAHYARTTGAAASARKHNWRTLRGDTAGKASIPKRALVPSLSRQFLFYRLKGSQQTGPATRVQAWAGARWSILPMVLP